MKLGAPTLLGIPYDASSSFLRGAATAPPLIRQALRSPSSNSWTEALVDVSDRGVLEDAGDVDLDGANDPRAVISYTIVEIAESGGRPISLGGDHSITFPILRALRPTHPQLSVLHIDAHPDIYDSFEGDPYSHASPFARIMEAGLCDRLVQVGIRTMSPPQRAQVERYGVEVIDMPSWAAGRRPELTGPVYITIDIDGIDPAFAPGVSHPEPGGLSVREVVTMIQSLRNPLVGADIVEYNPIRDINGLTAYVCAKLVKEIVGRMVAPTPTQT
jgi:agmatinase